MSSDSRHFLQQLCLNLGQHYQQVAGPVQKVAFGTFTAVHREDLSISAEHELCVDFLVHTPREYVVYFNGNPSIGSVRGLSLGCLNYGNSTLSVEFWTRSLQPNLGRRLANEKLFP